MAPEIDKATLVRSEKQKLKRELTILPLFALIYFTVCGGAFGAEPMVGLSGPGLALLLMVITPLVFSIPNMLMVREMQSMMPVEGGYYHWVKQAFGPFIGFMSGWMNWVVSWVDVSIYPVWTAWYLSYFIPALSDGATIGGIHFSSDLLSWLVSAALIITISLLNVRGAKLSGLTASWLGVAMIIPIIIMSGFGIYAWIVNGTPSNIPFLPGGAEVSGRNLLGALSVGIYVAMWNFMGWELPTAAGDEIKNPKKTYPRAMVLVLIATILSYSVPTVAGLYGGAGEDGQYLAWGLEESAPGTGIGPILNDYGIADEKMLTWGIDPGSDAGWEFPTIAHRIGDKVAGKDSPLSYFLGAIVGISAIFSMVGLFIGNGLGGTRVPYAMAEDGMMPTWLNKVHPKYGTPWVSILICGAFYLIFSTSAFQNLVVIDVFLNMLVLMAEIFALVVLRYKKPDIPRKRVPGGIWGLIYIVVAPLTIIIIAIVSQIIDYGWQGAVGLALIAMAIGAVLYFPIRKWVKKDIPDVDPYVLEAAEEA
ncbi:MAG TPA: APC family permease [Anaerolineaceae bacterium]|mgnify:FL=1|nr:APC family permease [Chloroflexota bacterium]HOE01790.1 APC family permease [Anaerolineaceae bacterium]HOQ69807.1 APC family permease [Anaerolineaceae bacterium]HOS53360.1 APC family permease [Anaerolineaceae bacterium]HPD62440.1 APC family permease [Anaerolineaceae bacterium]